ncbi:MAG: hypothetical protein GY809_19410 [Planctomycetes bacterium]|nr:hypothetical protein [Planctomycetota bacterium]
MRSIIFTLSVLCVLATSVMGAPEPAVVQSVGQWTADATFEPLRQLVYQPTENAEPRRFWYTILTIENRTGRDIGFFSKCDLMTDTFQVLPAGKLVPVAVFDRIKQRHQRKYPLLQHLPKVKSKILQGEDNAVDVAIIWSDIKPKTKNVKLFISGLSNETAAVKVPGVEDTVIFLRKTLELSFQLKGESVWRSDSDIVFKGKRWVMR